MQCVILAGGMGTRLWPDTATTPKPMVTIGGIPMIEHIMRRYRAAPLGVDEFIICTGPLAHVFHNWAGAVPAAHLAAGSEPDVVRSAVMDGVRTLFVATGATAQTATRLARIRPLLHPTEPVHLAYGDGLADVDLAALTDYHRHAGFAATMTVVHPPSRFGIAELDTGTIFPPVRRFDEKPLDPRWANGGFFVLDPAAFDAIDPAVDEPWESGPLTRLAAAGRLGAWCHTGFWACMDAPRDRQHLEDLWADDDPPWQRAAPPFPLPSS